MAALDMRAWTLLAKSQLFAGVRGTVLAAAILTFLVDVLLEPPTSGLDLTGRLLAVPLAVLVAFLIGRWLGRRTWPKRGRKLTVRLLRRATRGGKRPLLFLTDRPDHDASVWRRVLEVVGFATGAAVLLAIILTFRANNADATFSLAGILTLLLLWGSFVLVPYWLFARMGLRQVDPVRWFIQPMSATYASRLRLSNGALLLIALGALFNLFYRLGLTEREALLAGTINLARLISGVLVIAATATAYYQLEERALMRELEAEALREGVRDGRGMTDGDFLPRLPVK